LSIFLNGLRGPRDEAIQAKFAFSSSASQAHGSQGADELTFEQVAEDHRIAAQVVSIHQDGALTVAGDRDAALFASGDSQFDVSYIGGKTEAAQWSNI
jgi:hypothetical protein